MELRGERCLMMAGGLLILFAAQTDKGFLFRLASKVPSAENQQMVVSFTATACTFFVARFQHLFRLIIPMLVVAPSWASISLLHFVSSLLSTQEGTRQDQ